MTTISVLQQSTSEQQPQTLRQFSRTSKLSSWLGDFVTSHKQTSVVFGLHNYLQYTHLATHFQPFLSNVSKVIETQSYEEVVGDQNWTAAMQEEIAVLQGNDTWILVDLPPKKIDWVQMDLQGKI